MQTPKIAGPEAFNLLHPEPIAWRTSAVGWVFAVTGAGDSSFDGEYRAEDAAAGLYRHAERDDRFLNYLSDYGSPYWSMGSGRVTSMPGDYYTSGSLDAGPDDGQWSVGYSYDPAPTVTKTSAALTGAFRYQIVAVADPESVPPPGDDDWQASPDDNAVTPSHLAEGSYRLYVQERIDADEWTEAGAFDFTVSAYLPAAPVISGPSVVNTTFARFRWRTGKSAGKRITVTGFGAYSSYHAAYDGVYLPHGDQPGVWKHETNDRYFFLDRQWSSYYGRYYCYWVFNESTGGTYNSPAYMYLGDNVQGDPDNPPTTGQWSGDMGPGVTPIMNIEEMVSMTGRFRFAFVDAASGDPVGPSVADDPATTAFWENIPVGQYRLEVSELVSPDNPDLWSEVGSFAFSATRDAIPAPTVTGTTPTDIFAPTLSIRSNAPGPERFVAYNAGTLAANGVYAEAGTLNGFKLFKRIDADVFCFNGREYDSRLWAVYGDPVNPWTPSPQGESEYNWPYPRWYYNYNGFTPDGGPPEGNWHRADGSDPAPTLKYGNYANGQGAGNFRFRVDGGAWSELFTGTSFTLPEQSPGVHRVEAQEMGENGVWSGVGAFDVDTSLIPAPTVNGPNESDGGWHLYFTWSRNSGNRGTANYRYRLNGGPWFECGGVTNIRSLGQFPDGVNLFDVQEKSTTGGWSAVGTLAIDVVNGQASAFVIPDGFRVVVVDPSGRECLWRGSSLRREYTPLLVPVGGEGGDVPVAPLSSPLMAPAMLAATATVAETSEADATVSGDDAPVLYFVTSGDRYHLSDCPYAKTGVAMTPEQIHAREGTPCKRCNPPAF